MVGGVSCELTWWCVIVWVRFVILAYYDDELFVWKRINAKRERLAMSSYPSILRKQGDDVFLYRISREAGHSNTFLLVVNK